MLSKETIISFSRVTQTLINKCHTILLPPRCLLCTYPSQRMHNLCQPCEQSLPILSQFCWQCAHSYHCGANLSKLPSSDIRCGDCLKKTRPFDRTLALFPYLPPIIQLITQLKFHGQLANARLFGELMAEKIAREWYRENNLPDVIVPIPLHEERLAERGFNQALEIARPIAKRLKLPLDIKGAHRCKATLPQSGLTASLRKRNISGAFTVTRNYQGCAVAVIDDVITTGQTVEAFCLALKQAGAGRIDVWCVARVLANKI